MKEIIFRQAVLEDVEKIITLCDECFDEKTNLEYARKVFEETMYDKNQIYIIGEIDGQIVAHMKITIIPTIYEQMNTYAILNHVCVKPEFRRHRIATHLLDYAKEVCKSRNAIAMELWSKNFREAAHACYKDYGFIVEDAKFFSKDI